MNKTTNPISMTLKERERERERERDIELSPPIHHDNESAT